MSLDIYLTSKEKVNHTCTCPTCDNEHENNYSPCLWSANTTHNHGKMADAVGLYECVWRPDEHGIDTASQMIQLLQYGISKLEKDPKKYRTFNPENGWGSYETFLKFLKEYLKACKENPDAKITVSR